MTVKSKLGCECLRRRHEISFGVLLLSLPQQTARSPAHPGSSPGRMRISVSGGAEGGGPERAQKVRSLCELSVFSNESCKGSTTRVSSQKFERSYAGLQAVGTTLSVASLLVYSVTKC